MALKDLTNPKKHRLQEKRDIEMIDQFLGQKRINAEQRLVLFKDMICNYLRRLPYIFPKQLTTTQEILPPNTPEQLTTTQQILPPKTPEFDDRVKSLD